MEPWWIIIMVYKAMLENWFFFFSFSFQDLEIFNVVLFERWIYFRISTVWISKSFCLETQYVEWIDYAILFFKKKNQLHN